MPQDTSRQTHTALARSVGLSLLAVIVIGIATSILISPGLDINLSADVAATAEAMLGAEQRLRAMAYSGVLGFALEAFVGIGLFALLQRYGAVLAAWCLALSLAAAGVGLAGAVFAMNAAELASNAAYAAQSDEALRRALLSLQATSDYTSFHVGLVVGSVAKAGFFSLFLRSGLIPALISGWGVFASLFVASTIVARDFIPVLGHSGVTLAFILSNLVAIASTALYLTVRGVRPSAAADGDALATTDAPLTALRG